MKVEMEELNIKYELTLPGGKVLLEIEKAELECSSTRKHPGRYSWWSSSGILPSPESGETG